MKIAFRLGRTQPGMVGLLIASTGLLCWISALRAAEPASDKSTATNQVGAPSKPSETPGEFRNWAEISVGSTFISGDRPAFKQRSGLPQGPFGGMEDFHYEQDVGKRGLFQIDGRAIFDHHDYDVKLQLSHPEKGYVRAGYREFRTYYDGSGGYLPRNKQWISLYDEDFALDRREAWIEGGLTLPDWPELRVKYSHQIRDGMKDSTSWGDTALTGLTGANNVRGIVPSFWTLDETRDIIEGEVKKTFGNTEVSVGLRYEISGQDNSRNIHRRPGEPQDRYVTQKESVDTDLFSVHGSSATRFSESVLFTLGYSFTKLDTDISGSRIYGSSYDPVYDPVYARRQQRDEGFLDLEGGSEVRQHVVNLNLRFTPWEHVTLTPSIRIEHQDQSGLAGFTETTVGAGPAFNSTQDLIENTRERQFTDVSEALELRYTGLTNWVFYVRGEWLEGQGDLQELETEEETGLVRRDTDSSRFVQKYVAGVNWYPWRKLNLGGQYYYKSRRNDYDHRVDSTTNAPPSSDRYPAYLRSQDFATHDMNFRVTWRPLAALSLISRYDFQISTIDSHADFLSKVQSAESTAHIFSETVSWTPMARLYLQGSLNYVLDQTDTPAAGQITTNIILNARNNYWNASGTVGFVLSDKSDLQSQYTYYRANNYADNSDYSVPYGAGAEEHGITATLIHRFTRRLQWTVRYGFFTGHNQTSGGHNDYRAHLVYSSLRYAF